MLTSIQKEFNSTQLLLVFNKNSSYFSSESMTNEANRSPLSKSGKSIFNLNGDFYSDLINKTNYNRLNLDIYKDDLIIKELSSYKWIINAEKKKIGDYECFQAISNNNGISITAWFSPEINYSVGPANFNGLPGAILELSVNSEK